MTARLIHISNRTDSRFQSILFCRIHTMILTIIQMSVNINSAVKKEISSIIPDLSLFQNSPLEEYLNIYTEDNLSQNEQLGLDLSRNSNKKSFVLIIPSHYY